MLSAPGVSSTLHHGSSMYSDWRRIASPTGSRSLAQAHRLKWP